MGELTRELRRRLLSILEALEILNEYNERTPLLDDMPGPLVNSIGRNTSKKLDLDAIVRACVSWQPLPGAAVPMETLLENAIDIAAGQQAAIDLQAILNALQEPASNSATPRAPITSGGIPAVLYTRLRNTLLNCGPFGNDDQVRTVFAHALLSPFRDGVPGASTPSGRVDALLSYLIGKRRTDTQANALVLFLQVIRDRIDAGDSCYADLDSLATELERALSGPSSGN